MSDSSLDLNVGAFWEPLMVCLFPASSFGAWRLQQVVYCFPRGRLRFCLINDWSGCGENNRFDWGELVHLYLLHPIVAQHRSKFSQLAAGLLTLQYARRGNVERYTADTTTAVSATVVCVYDSNLAHTRAIDWANARWSTQSVRTLQ